MTPGLRHGRLARRLLLAALLVGTAACRVVQEDPLRPRFFTPEPGPQNAATPAAPAGPALRLGWVRAAEHLGFRIGYRESAEVYRFYERRRWNESPAVYLERALRRRLYLREGLTRSLDAGDPTLEVTLLAFEELRAADDPERPAAGRVVLGWVLLREGKHLGEGTCAEEEPLAFPPEPGGDVDTGPLLARALGVALERAVDRLGAATAAQLGAPR